MAFPGLRLSEWFTLHGFFTVLAVLVYTVHAHVVRQRRAPTAAIAWMLFILLLPYLALPAYLVFGTRKVVKPRALPPIRPTTGSDAPQAWVADTLRALAQRPAAAYTALQVHADGHAARGALFGMLQDARHTIDISTFLIGRDALGEAVQQLLCARARAGVRVRVLVDGLGWWMGGRPDLRALGEAGVDLRLFVPPWKSPLRGRSNLRNHRKMLLTDVDTPAARLWCGGRNLAQEYFEGGPGSAPWRDLSFDLQGALVAQAHQLFEHDWRFAAPASQPAAVAGPVPLPGPASATASASVPAPFAASDAAGPWPLPGTGASPPAPPPAPPPASPPAPPSAPPDAHAFPCTTTGEGAQLVASGPDQFDDTFHALLVTAAYRARERLALATPYFVPDMALLIALCMAARRGVAVDLLMPARSNHPLSDFARSRALRALAQAGGRIWLVPTMLHAKLVVVDETVALAGSANLDSRSLFINYELMVAFHQREDVRRFAQWFATEKAPAAPYVPRPPGLARDVAEGLLLWAGFQL
jgi:cardiolipin synthase